MRVTLRRPGTREYTVLAAALLAIAATSTRLAITQDWLLAASVALAGIALAATHLAALSSVRAAHALLAGLLGDDATHVRTVAATLPPVPYLRELAPTWLRAESSESGDAK